jgi:spermidine/putrescine transport system substrate-binding protein
VKSRTTILWTIIVLLLGACQVKTPTPKAVASLTVRSWEDDMPEDLFADFSAQTGIEVVLDPYETQEEAIEELITGKAADVVVMDSRFIKGMADDKLLREINRSHIPNYRYISAGFRGLAFDPNNRYSIPYQWGTTGIVYRADLTGREITRWADLWDPAFKGKVGLWKGQSRETIGLTLKMLGYSANSENPTELSAAMKKLEELAHFAAFLEEFDPYSAVPGLLDGRIYIALGYAYDAIEGGEQNENIKFVLPEEGTVLWGEHFIIPVTSANPQAAEKLLNYLLEPEKIAAIANYNHYAVPHDGALELLSPELRGNPLVYPPESDLIDAEIIFQISPLSEGRYQTAWSHFVDVTEAGSSR